MVLTATLGRENRSNHGCQLENTSVRNLIVAVVVLLNITCQMEIKETNKIEEATGFLLAVGLLCKKGVRSSSIHPLPVLQQPITTAFFQMMCTYTHPSALTEMPAFGLLSQLQIRLP